MLLMDPNNKNAVYRMDLEYGKVVDEWKVHDSINVENILPESVLSLNRAYHLIAHWSLQGKVCTNEPDSDPAWTL